MGSESESVPESVSRNVNEPLKVLTRTVFVSVIVKFYDCVNGNGPFHGGNGFCTHSARQCKFDDDGDGDGDGTCKRTLKTYWVRESALHIYVVIKLRINKA